MVRPEANDAQFASQAVCLLRVEDTNDTPVGPMTGAVWALLSQHGGMNHRFNIVLVRRKRCNLQHGDTSPERREDEKSRI
jgi:hypothetical protein